MQAAFNNNKHRESVCSNCSSSSGSENNYGSSSGGIVGCCKIRSSSPVQFEPFHGLDELALEFESNELNQMKKIELEKFAMKMRGLNSQCSKSHE